jgi:hypothetical protein
MKPRLAEFFKSVDDGWRDGAAEPSPRRLTTLDTREGFSGSPRIGAEVGMGEPGVTATAVRVDGACEAGELYMYVAPRTIEEPTIKARVMG